MKDTENQTRASVKRALAVAAVASAGTYAVLKNDKAKLAVQNFGYRAHSRVMDIGTKIYPAMFPMPEIRKGCGSVQQLPEILRSYGVHSPMIVTGPTIGKTIVPPIVEMLADQGFACTVFDRTEANPSVTTVEKIRDLYRERGCDSFLAIGGGSPMDAAKIAAAAIAKPGQPIQKMAGMMRILAKVAPIICVPTTAGTGSEVTIGAVISDHDTHHKYAITDPCVTPKATILDPELTVSMPPFITETTGVDALTHAVESYVTCMYNTDKTNKWCEDAVVSIFRYLERAYNAPNDMEAREQMLYASCTAGLAFTRTGVGMSMASRTRWAGCIIRRTVWQTPLFSRSCWRTIARPFIRSWPVWQS